MHNIITITYNYAQKLYCNKRCKAWKSFQLKLKFNDMEILLSSFILTKRSKKCNANSRPSQHKGWHQIPPPKFVDKSRLSIFQVITEITDVRWNYHCAACPWRGTFGLYFLNTEFVVILSKDSSNSIISWYCCLIKTRDISSKTKLRKICMVQK